jgi:hypothetical protein
MLLTNGLAAAAWIPPDLARPMRQMRMVTRCALVHKYTAGPLSAWLGNRHCDSAEDT